MSASAHEFTPTYVKPSISAIDGVYEATFTLFNSRKDIKFYELAVFDVDWVRVPFATDERTIQVEYLSRKPITIYLRERDLIRAMYVCTQSKILLGNKQASIISSRICSKLIP